ncbi:MAG: amino acid ABC transporter permease [Eubacteriales bacterium]|jgi:His/Glu/Gln/Arg/opine family amino acid ABC transporter permease subunit|nr:amino acid ABC transporter permease [Eubacteriales bacterium]
MFILEAIRDFFVGLGSQFYQTMIVDDRWKMLISGLQNTLIIAFFALLIGVAIGTFVAIVKVMAVMNSKSKLLRLLNWLCNIYINIIRGTPVVVQLLIMYFVVFVSVTNALFIAIVSFGLNSGAYVAEIMRAGILAVDKGQTEAGRSLGLSGSQTMKAIILPQAIKNILPALCNEFITLLKETSIAGYVAIQDLTKAGDRIRFTTYDPFTPLIVVALIYLVMVLGLTWIIGKFERRLAKSDNR